ncbi:likely mitochondrial ribosomal protein [Pseudozyma hubeiensis SY62]|uniref:Likely mitochondrial ribosomal protein n=1 Tax=Pseudozyma hubeiensis (strain SY62) TaxID=1305764 RepID=R9PES7_PSEHS|nr:likely mitochondrial ribosomal protein [Pseudozyma hubeiensis SY62]GAC99873.1 likely mitochondrial ribosomal protein [Pseudozyma hubeiensis SY62]
MSAASLTRSLARLSLASGSQAARIPVRQPARFVAPVAHSSLRILARTYATPASSATIRLGNLQPGQPTKNRKRLGRGPSSGRGGTSTRGHKGQKARAGNGKPVPGFEGGQTPLTRRYPKRGFNNVHGQTFVPVNLDKIQHWIDRGLLDPSRPITAKELYETRCIHSLKDGVKILGEGANFLDSSVNLIVSRASQSAIDAIEKAGGSVECRYYTPLSLRALVKPHKFAGKILPRAADPINKKDLVWYSSPRNRGYLAKRAALTRALNAEETAAKEESVSEATA